MKRAPGGKLYWSADKPAEALGGAILLIAVAIAVGPVAAQTGAWVRLDDGPRRFGLRHDDVFFVHPDTGWVVNTGSEVFRTNDGGVSWEEQVRGSLPGIGMRAFRSVGFANSSKGWIGSLTFGSVLFETLDGGETWADITGRINGEIEPAGICGISVVDADHAFGVGRWTGPAVFVKTVDGGQTWQASSLESLAGTLVDVHFFDENEGFAVGGTTADLGSSSNRAVVLHTSDGGQTWTRRHVSSGPTSEWGWKISFPSRLVGYVSIEYRNPRDAAKVLKTVDGGLTWGEVDIPGNDPYRGLQGVGFLTEELGWVGGRGEVSQTVDGGSMWQSYSNVDGRVNRFRVLVDSIAYAVGEYVYRFKVNLNGDSTGTIAPLAIESTYPQPASEGVTIRYHIDVEASVTAEVLDATGRRILKFSSLEVVGPGTHELVWDGRTGAGARAASGWYLVRLRAGERIAQGTIILVRTG